MGVFGTSSSGGKVDEEGKGQKSKKKRRVERKKKNNFIVRPMCFELCPSQGSSCNTKLGTFKKDEYQKKKKRNPFVSCSSCNLQMLLYANICSVYKQGLSRWLLLLSKCLLSVQLGVNIFLALVVGAIFFGVKDDQSGIQNR